MGSPDHRRVARISHQSGRANLAGAAETVAATFVFDRFEPETASDTGASDSVYGSLWYQRQKTRRRVFDFFGGPCSTDQHSAVRTKSCAFSSAQRRDDADDHGRTRYWYRAVPRIFAGARSDGGQR